MNTSRHSSGLNFYQTQIQKEKCIPHGCRIIDIDVLRKGLQSCQYCESGKENISTGVQKIKNKEWNYFLHSVLTSNQHIMTTVSLQLCFQPAILLFSLTIIPLWIFTISLTLYVLNCSSEKTEQRCYKKVGFQNSSVHWH